MTDLATDNPSTGAVDNPDNQTGTQSSVTGTGASGGQAQGGAPDDIFKGIDPNRLPPELKTVYDSMLTDYRGKTAKISETTKAEVAKATEAFRSKAELYDQIAAQEEFVKLWNDHVQKVNSNGQAANNSDPALAQMNQMKAQLQEMNQKIQMNEMAQITEAFAEAVNEKGEKIHPEFDQLNSISVGQIKNGTESEDFSLLRTCIELAPGNNPTEKLANGYKVAKATYDAIFESGKQAGMGRLKTKLSNGSLPPTNSGSESLSVTDKRPKSAHEALEMARKGQVVSR